MKEYTTPLREAFVAGIAPTGDTLRNSDRLVIAKNLRPYEGGLRLQQIPEPIVNGVYRTEWPFPQLYLASCGFFLGSKDMLSHFSSRLVRYSTLDVNPGLAWSVADFGKSAFLCNGVTRAWLNPSDDTHLNLYSATNVPTANCCCDFNRGQLILGGIKSDWNGCDESFVAWSKIGNIDCTPGASNEAGFMPLDADGEVVCVKQLGQHVIAYSTFGVVSLVPVKDPAATWGQRTFECYGVPYRTAVTGDKKNHYFVDVTGAAWRLTANMELIPLGGKHLIAPMMRNSQIVATFHPRRDEMYVSNAEYHYVHTKTGWGGPNYIPLSGTAFCLPEGKKIGGLAVVPVKQFVGNFDYAEFVTDILNFSRAGQKTLQWIEVECIVDGSYIEVAADYKYETTPGWGTTGWRTVNKEGVGFLPIAGTDFRIRVRVGDPHAVEVDSMRIRWKATDARFSRGAEMQLKGGATSE